MRKDQFDVSPDSVQQQALGGADDQARSELAEDGEVEAGVLQFQAEGIFLIDAAANGLGGLAVEQALGKLQHGNQRQPPRRQAGLTAHRNNSVNALSSNRPPRSSRMRRVMLPF